MVRQSAALWPHDSVVQSAGGRLRGSVHSDRSVRRFLGVRYAQAPVGEQRWRPPVPVRAWTGTRDAQTRPPAPMQVPPRTTSLYYGGESTLSEDCLFLNVWTGGEGDTGRPVLVWLHWGGFQFGSANNPIYDGERLARSGATVVTVNYRVGRLGFLAHPGLTAESEHGASGNYGLLDQLEALRWVQRSITAFGGDRDNVTVFGCSAGAISTWMLRSSPLATGLFHRAIAHSGLGFAPSTDGPGAAGVLQTLPAAETAGAEFAAALEAPDVAALRRLSAEAIMSVRLPRQVGPWTLPFLPPGVGLSDAPFDTGYPVVDGHVLPRTPRDVFAAGDQLDIPMIAGNVGNEASGLPYIASREAYLRAARTTYGDLADELLSLYPAADDPEARAASNRLIGDRMFTWGTRTGLRLHARTGHAPVHSYRFLREPPIPQGEEVAEDRDRVRCFHGADVQYVFGTLPVRKWPWTSADRRLSHALRTTWVAFARTGHINGHGLPEWPEFDQDRPTTMLLDVDPRVGDLHDRDRMNFWDRYYTSHQA